jgi:hypothetical protein
MSIGFGKKVFVKLHKDLREKIAEVVHFAEIPALAIVSARRKISREKLKKLFSAWCVGVGLCANPSRHGWYCPPHGFRT